MNLISTIKSYFGYFTLYAGGGGSSKAPTQQNVTQTSIPEYARPYVETALGKTAALTDINQNPYQPYQGQQVAGLSPMQQQAMGSIGGQQVSSQLGTATDLATQSGLGGLAAQQSAMGLQGTALGYGQAGSTYGGAASQFGAAGAQQAQQTSMQAQRQAAMYGAQGAQYGAQGAGQAAQAQRVAEGQADIYGQMGAGYGAQASSLAPEAQAYGAGAAQMGQAGMGYGAQGAGIGGIGVQAAQQGFGAGAQYAQQATSPEAMGAYMSPYMQNVVDVQSQEARRQADISRQGQKSQAVGQGAFGGSRSAIVAAEGERNLATQLGQIQAQGSQQAYQQAQQAQQFGANLGLQGLQAGYQGLQTGMQGTAQGMQGAQTGIQGQQAGMQGVGQAGQMYGLGMQGAGLGLQGTGQRLAAGQLGLQGTAQGMQGAQTGLQGVGQQLAGGQLGLQGAQTGISGQQAGMQGAGVGLSGVQAATGAGQYGLQGLGTAGSAASTLGALGQTQYGQQMGINQAQMQAGALQQAQEQRGLDIAYQQYQDQLNYPYKQLAFQSDMFRGLPLSQSATTMYQNTGAMAPQLMGAGIAAYGASQRVKNGGTVKSYAEGGTTTVDPSVPSSIGPQALSSRLAKLSDEQLMAYARTVKDAVALAEVKGEIQRREEARAPQGQMPTGTVAQGIAPEEAPQVPVMAGGGIVALSNGGNENQSEFRQDAATAYAREAEKRERQLTGAPLATAVGPLGYFTTPRAERAAAAATLAELKNAPIEDIRAYRDTGAIPRSEDPFGGSAEVAGMAEAQAREAERRQAEATQAQAEGAQMGNLIAGEGQVRPAQLAQAEYAAETGAQATQENAQEGSGQYPNLSAPPGTPRVGIAAPGVTGQVPAAPMAGAPAGQAPAAPTGSTGIVPSSKAPAAMATGAIPIANPNDPMGWGAYKASVDDAAKLDPEQKAVLEDMRKRSERKMARAEKQEKNVFNESLIAGGLAMMGGLNLSDGVRRLAEGGGKKYFESSAEARKAIETADDAQSAFDQYQLSLKQGNKKVAADMYGKFHNSMMDFNGKIQAASISAGASRENAQAQREATESYRKDQIEQRNLDRDALMQRHEQNVQIHKDDFKIKTEQTNNTKAQTLMSGYESQLGQLEGRVAKLNADAQKLFSKQREEIQFTADKPEVKAAKLKALELKQAAELKEARNPLEEQKARILARQDNLMSQILGTGAGEFKVTGVR